VLEIFGLGQGTQVAATFLKKERKSNSQLTIPGIELENGTKGKAERFQGESFENSQSPWIKSQI
jgi:hypothetical protein